MADRNDGFADTVIELRGMTPRRTIDVIDAIAQASGNKTRIDVVNEVLGDWAEKEVRKAQAIERVLRGRQ